MKIRILNFCELWLVIEENQDQSTQSQVSVCCTGLKMLLLFFAGFLFAGGCFADTPANCTIEDVVGEWVFYEGQISKKPDLDCTQIRKSKNLKLFL